MQIFVPGGVGQGPRICIYVKRPGVKGPGNCRFMDHILMGTEGLLPTILHYRMLL